MKNGKKLVALWRQCPTGTLPFIFFHFSVAASLRKPPSFISSRIPSFLPCFLYFLFILSVKLQKNTHTHTGWYHFHTSSPILVASNAWYCKYKTSLIRTSPSSDEMKRKEDRKDFLKLRCLKCHRRKQKQQQQISGNPEDECYLLSSHLFFSNPDAELEFSFELDLERENERACERHLFAW